MRRMARFIIASRRVVELDSCPWTAMLPSRPPCSSTNFSLCRNLPAEPQHGSWTRLLVDSSLVRREHLEQHADHAARRVELSAVLPFRIEDSTPGLAATETREVTP